MSMTALTLEQASAHLASIAETNYRGRLIVVAPADTQQLAETLRYANQSNFVVTASGSGTKLHWGNPVEAHIEISLARMNAVREHSWQDMTCTVDAGCKWNSMRAALARHAQMVALDPLWPETATIGGIVAANDSGALRLKYGPLRDLIIGMTVVLADGTIAKTGGKVVKNVAGYDLHKLMTGSFGTLGIIASVNFRLHPVEQHARTFTVVSPETSLFDRPLHAMLDSQLIPSCIQIRAHGQECAVDIRIATRPECFDEQASRLANIFAPFALCETSEDVWLARQQLFDSQDALILKVACLPSENCSIITELQQHATAEQMKIRIVAQAYGLMTIVLNAAPAQASPFIDHLRTRLRSSGGSVVAQQIPDAMRGTFDPWGCDSNALPLMREIKRRFDPNRILNPGRFVGSI